MSIVDAILSGDSFIAFYDSKNKLAVMWDKRNQFSVIDTELDRIIDTFKRSGNLSKTDAIQIARDWDKTSQVEDEGDAKNQINLI